MPKALGMNLSPIRIVDIACAAGGFAVGVVLGLFALSLVRPVDPDLGPFLSVVFAIPLAISPFIYIFGDFVGRFLDLSQWLTGGALIVLWLVAPAAVALLSLRVQLRFIKKPTI